MAHDDEFGDLVIHVGYHKAGSTLLQKQLFVPRRGIYSEWSQDFYHRRVLLDRPDRGWAARVRASFAPGMEEARRRGLTPVLSCEALSGDMWRVGQANGYGNFHVARTLAEAFPGARVAIVHREQTDMVTSLYKHSLRSHWRYSLKHFIDQAPLERGMAPVLNFGYLEYSWLLETYQTHFGTANVLALPFEMLREIDVWCLAWSRFLGIEISPQWFAAKENVGFSAATALGKRLTNYAIPGVAEPNRTRTGHFLASAAYKVDAKVPRAVRVWSDQRLRDEVARAVRGRFGQDNDRLSDMTDLDLRWYGYASQRTNSP